MWIWGFSVEVCWELGSLMFDIWIYHAYYSAMSGSFVYGMLIFLCWAGERVINILVSDLRESKPSRGLFKDFLSPYWNRYSTSFTMIFGLWLCLIQVGKTTIHGQNSWTCMVQIEFFCVTLLQWLVCESRFKWRMATLPREHQVMGLMKKIDLTFQDSLGWNLEAPIL